jgi:hypothetical protein
MIKHAIYRGIASNAMRRKIANGELMSGRYGYEDYEQHADQ